MTPAIYFEDLAAQTILNIWIEGNALCFELNNTHTYRLGTSNGVPWDTLDGEIDSLAGQRIAFAEATSEGQVQCFEIVTAAGRLKVSYAAFDPGAPPGITCIA